MDGARDAVQQLCVQLRQLVCVIDTGLGDISDGGRLNNVPDHELLDRLVLRYASGAVGASDSANVSAAVLRASVVSPLRGHRRRSLFDDSLLCLQLDPPTVAPTKNSALYLKKYVYN